MMDTNSAIDAFMTGNHVKQVTSLLLDVLADNKREDAELQTRLFEIVLTRTPHVAERIFQLNMFSHYDRQKVAGLAEQAGLIPRAIEHYESMADIKRLLANSSGTYTADFLAAFFGRLNKADTLDSMKEILRANLPQNLGSF